MTWLPGPVTKRAVVRARRLALPVLRGLRPARYTDAEPYRILRVPFARIERMQQRWEGEVRLPWLEGGPAGLPSLRRRWHAGLVLDGDWDLATRAFEDHHLTRVLRARFVDGADWEDIPYVRSSLTKVRAGRPAWGGRCRTEDDVHDRCRYLDGLYASLADAGFCSEAAGDDARAFSPVVVNIGRDGTIIRNNDGKHRIILGRLLGLRDIEVRVLVRHRRWQQVREAVRAGDVRTRRIHADHPDLDDLRSPPSATVPWPSAHGHARIGHDRRRRS